MKRQGPDAVWERVYFLCLRGGEKLKVGEWHLRGAPLATEKEPAPQKDEGRMEDPGFMLGLWRETGRGAKASDGWPVP